MARACMRCPRKYEALSLSASAGCLMSPGEQQSDFVCSNEATALLNCVANKSFNQQKCISLMRKLRECILKEVLVRALAGPYWPSLSKSSWILSWNVPAEHCGLHTSARGHCAFATSRQQRQPALEVTSTTSSVLVFCSACMSGLLPYHCTSLMAVQCLMGWQELY